MIGKSNNSRRFPGESNRNRPDQADDRRTEAQERQAKTDSLTPKQRLEALDAKFGVGLGATKERARLATLMNASPNVKPKVADDIVIETLETALISVDIMAEIEAMNEEQASKKKVKAKDRRSRNQNIPQY